MKKTLLYIALGIVVLVGGFYALNAYIRYQELTPAGVGKDYKDTAYQIEGKTVALVNGVAEVDASANSATKITTKYFGNEAEGDLNGDGISDVAFILTQTTGGSGTFYYVVVALRDGNSYVGTNGVLLGDRIAPQTTEISNGTLVVNYADRKPNEPMTTSPSVGKTKYLEVVGGVLKEQEENGGVVCTADAMQCPDGSWVGRSGPKCEFICPGEAGKSGIQGTVFLGPVCPVVQSPPDPNCADKPYQASFNVTGPDGSGIIKTFNSDKNGVFKVEVPPGQYQIRLASTNVLPRCTSTQTIVVKANSYTEASVSCDSGIR